MYCPAKLLHRRDHLLGGDLSIEEPAGKFDSDSIAFYVDMEADLTERFSGGAAIRFEDYDAFGSTFDWKLRDGKAEIRNRQDDTQY